MSTIFVKSPKQGIKVAIGYMDIPNRIAYFYLKEKQVFTSAEAIGFDASLLNRKSFKWCNRYVFNLPDGRIIELTKDEFLKNAWRYPPEEDRLDYKANKKVFAPKFVLTFDKLKAILKNRPKKTEEDKLREFSAQYL